MRDLLFRVVGLLLGTAVAAASSMALEPTTPLAGYGRQSWVMENGLPQNTIQAMAQSQDGFLWLGTEVGLVRFDGYGFAVFDRNSNPALPGNDVRCLLASGDGALWIGTSEGLARWKNGATKTFTSQNGLPGNDIQALGVNSDGTVWISTSQGDADIRGDQVTAPGTAASSKPYPLLVDSVPLPGAGWANATATTLTIGRGDKRETSFTVGRELAGSKIQKLFADRQGSLWIGTNGGLARWSAGKLQRLPVTDPLARASVLAVLEDREGNLWVGTETDGLHILRDRRFHVFGSREGLSSDASTTVVEDGRGTLWVGTSGGGLNAFQVTPEGLGGAKTYTVRRGLASDVILSLAAAPNGDLWVGTPDGLSRIRNGVAATFTSADGLPDDFIRSLLADSDGTLWIGTRRGLAHWLLGGRDPLTARIDTFTQSSGLGSDLVGAMARDTRGDLWVATFAGLSRIRGGRISNFTTANGLSSNVVTALLPRGNGTLLVGTQDRGWNLWDGERFRTVAANGLEHTSIHAILEDGTKHLWFATASGIARCDCDMSGGCSHWIEFGPVDGLRSRETATNSHPSAWRSADGHLWFATPKGIVEVDPAHFPVNLVPAPVAIERFAVDDRDQLLAGAPIAIPAGHGHFQFDYAGLSFTEPQKVRYRYMLEGFDRGWTEAGSRRTAYYTNIPPGRYTFRVQAANNDGVWNTAGAALTFDLKPHFYQTLWFYLLLLAAAAGLVVLFLRRRLRVAEREFNAVLAERSRIAREIHDTLAQGYVGISVQLEVLSELLRMNKVDAAQKHLDSTRGYVREGLADARQSIWALRSQDSAETTLPVRMARLVEADGAHGLQAKFGVYGAYRPLPPGTERELLRVVQEAIHNVKKHADASELHVQLEYRPEAIALEVRDNGRGFAANGRPEPQSGHYGLTGMRERAAAIRGTLEIVSEPGAGTVVRLSAPAQSESKQKAGDWQ